MCRDFLALSISFLTGAHGHRRVCTRRADIAVALGLPFVEPRLLKFFGQIGQIKDDKKSREPGKKKVWIYKDKNTGAPKGDATVSYLDPNGAK